MDIANLNFLKKNDAPAKEKNNSVVKVIKGSAIAIILTLIFLSIYAALLTIKDMVGRELNECSERVEYDDDGNILHNVSVIPSLRAALKQVDVFCEYFNPTYLTLFD